MLTRALKLPRSTWLRFGYAGLAFFTIKGVLWLILPFIFVWYLQ